MLQEQRRADCALSRKGFLQASAAVAVAMAGAAAFTGCATGGSSSASQASTEVSAPKERKLSAVCAYSGAHVSPVGNSSALLLAANRHVLEALYDLDLHTYETYPALAATQPVRISDLEYEIPLRAGAVFSNGAPVTPADVIHAIALNLADATYGSFLSFIEEAQEKDAQTITLRLRYPFEGLLEKRLALVKIFPASLPEEELLRMPIGSGPWVYDSIDGTDGGAIEFVANKHYLGPFEAGADRMVWHVRLDGAERARMLRDGEVAVMEDVERGEVDRLVEVGASVDYERGFGQMLLVFNCLKEPFNDVRVRQAFFYAINAEKMINAQLAGHAQVFTSFLPKDHPNYHRASNVYTYNPEKARELLVAAGVNKLEFTMTTNNNRAKEYAAQIQEDLHAVGITMRNEQERIDWAKLAPSDDNPLLPFDVILTPGDPSCFGNDPDLLMSWWYGDNAWTYGRTCWAKARDGAHARLKALLESARMAPADQRQEIWNECFDLISENVPLYGLFHTDMVTAYLPGEVSGFSPLSTTGLDLLGVSPVV